MCVLTVGFGGGAAKRLTPCLWLGQQLCWGNTVHLGQLGAATVAVTVTLAGTCTTSPHSHPDLSCQHASSRDAALGIEEKAPYQSVCCAMPCCAAAALTRRLRTCLRLSPSCCRLR